MFLLTFLDIIERGHRLLAVEPSDVVDTGQTLIVSLHGKEVLRWLDDEERHDQEYNKRKDEDVDADIEPILDKGNDRV